MPQLSQPFSAPPASAHPQMRWRLILFAALMGCVIIVFMIGSSIRAATWHTNGSLWCDVINKLYDRRVFDRSQPGTEAPRCDRARPYNNIGLHLYDQARYILESRAYIRYYEQSKKPELLAPYQTREHDLTEELITAIPKEFRTTMLATILQDKGLPAPPPPREPYTKASFEAAFRTLIAEHPDWNPLIPAQICLERSLAHSPTYFIAHLNIGLVHQLQGHTTEAEQHYRLAHTFSNNYEKAYRYQAQILFQKEEFSEAIEAGIESYHRNPTAEMAQLIAVSAMACQENEIAERWFHRALQRGANSGDFWYAFAQLQFKKKDDTTALQMLKRATLAQRGYDPAYRAWGDWLIRHDRQKEAETIYLHYLSEAREYPSPYVLLCDLYLDDPRQITKATPLLKNALTRFPTNPLVLTLAGREAIAHHKPEQAREFLRDALRREPDTSEAWYWLAWLDQDTDRPQALFYIGKALALSPENPLFRNLSAKLHASN